MHILVADEDFLDLLNTWNLPWSWSLHCSETLSKASKVLPVLPQDNYSIPLFFHYATTLEKQIVEVFSISNMQFSAYSAMATNPDIRLSNYD